MALELSISVRMNHPVTYWADNITPGEKKEKKIIMKNASVIYLLAVGVSDTLNLMV